MPSIAVAYRLHPKEIFQSRRCITDDGRGKTLKLRPVFRHGAGARDRRRENAGTLVEGVSAFWG